MKLIYFICLKTLCAGALLVQAPSSVSVTSGSKVSLSCDITQMGGQCSQVVWLRVGQMSNLTVLSQFGVQSGTQCLLEISSASRQDQGKYYCVHINGLMLLTGNGATLTVTETRSHSVTVNLLVPLDGADSSLPVPLICLVSGLEDSGRVTVDWEVDEQKDGADGLQKLSHPRILPNSEAGVVSVQVYVDGETWVGGARVSCVLTDGELQIRSTVSSRTGMSSECVIFTSAAVAVCVVLLVITVSLSILLLCRKRRLNREPDGQPEPGDETSADIHYAALRFKTSGRRNNS